MPTDPNAPPIDLPVVTTLRLCTENWRRYFRTLADVVARLVATIGSVQVLASGSYTPTLTALVNVAASTAYVTGWLRVGGAVTVFGRVDVDATAVADTQLGLSLPVPSALTNVEQVGGTAADETGACAVAIYADVVNDRATLRWTPVTAVNRGYTFTFTYRVL